MDAKGVSLLPVSASSLGLPELMIAPPLPQEATAGKPWPDDVVVRAASIAAEYKPKTIAHSVQGWELMMPDGKKLMVGERERGSK